MITIKKQSKQFVFLAFLLVSLLSTQSMISALIVRPPTARDAELIVIGTCYDFLFSANFEGKSLATIILPATPALNDEQIEAACKKVIKQYLQENRASSIEYIAISTPDDAQFDFFNPDDLEALLD